MDMCSCCVKKVQEGGRQRFQSSQTDWGAPCGTSGISRLRLLTWAVSKDMSVILIHSTPASCVTPDCFFWYEPYLCLSFLQTFFHSSHTTTTTRPTTTRPPQTPTPIMIEVQPCDTDLKTNTECLFICLYPDKENNQLKLLENISPSHMEVCEELLQSSSLLHMVTVYLMFWEFLVIMQWFSPSGESGHKIWHHEMKEAKE